MITKKSAQAPADLPALRRTTSRPPLVPGRRLEEIKKNKRMPEKWGTHGILMDSPRHQTSAHFSDIRTSNAKFPRALLPCHRATPQFRRRWPGTTGGPASRLPATGKLPLGKLAAISCIAAGIISFFSLFFNQASKPMNTACTLLPIKHESFSNGSALGKFRSLSDIEAVMQCFSLPHGFFLPSLLSRCTVWLGNSAGLFSHHMFRSVFIPAWKKKLICRSLESR